MAEGTAPVAAAKTTTTSAAAAAADPSLSQEQSSLSQSSSTTTSLSQEESSSSSSSLLKLEELSEAVVRLIQRCLNVVRSCPEFQGPSTATAANNRNSNSNSNSNNVKSKNRHDDDVAEAVLFTNMVENGLVEAVAETCSAVRNFNNFNNNDGDDDDGPGLLLLAEGGAKRGEGGRQRREGYCFWPKLPLSHQYCKSIQINNTRANSSSSSSNCNNNNNNKQQQEQCEHHDERQRFQVVHRVLLPLLDALGICYWHLDRISPEVMMAHQQQQQQQQQKSSLLFSRLRGNSNSNNNLPKKQSRPPPRPEPGMLSIAQYTDVAGIIEWTVCWSLLSSARACGVHVLAAEESSPQRRAARLPKSLAGRLPRRSLLLWSEGGGKEVHDEYKQQHATNTTTNDSENSSSSSSSNRRSEAQTAVLFLALEQRKRELAQTCCVVGNLLLLDRFRPMLLPRHLPDLCAALLQINELDKRTMIIKTKRRQQQHTLKAGATREHHHNKKNGNGDKDDEKAVHRKQQQPQEDDALLEKAVQNLRTKVLAGAMANAGAFSREEATVAVQVDALHQAHALQTLLLKTPPPSQRPRRHDGDGNTARASKSVVPQAGWWRRALADELAATARRDLDAILQVYVLAAAPGDRTAAALRLAHALTAPPAAALMATAAPKTTATMGSNIINNKKAQAALGLFCKQQAQLADQVLVVLDAIGAELLVPSSTAGGKKTSCGFHAATAVTARQETLLFACRAILLRLLRPRLQSTRQSGKDEENIASSMATADHVLQRLGEGFVPNCHRPTGTENGCDDDNDVALHRNVRRLGLLCMSGCLHANHIMHNNPSISEDSAQLCRLLLLPLPLTRSNNCSDCHHQPTITLSILLLRVAAMPTIVKSVAKEDALWTLRWWVQTMTDPSTTFRISPISEDSNCVFPSSTSGSDVLGLALVCAMAPSQWDLKGHSFSNSGAMTIGSSSSKDEDDETARDNSNNKTSLFECLRFVPGEEPGTEDGIGSDMITGATAVTQNSLRLIQGVEERATFVVNQLLLPLLSAASKTAPINTNRYLSEPKGSSNDTCGSPLSLPSWLLCILVSIYFSSGLSSEASSSFPSYFQREPFEMVAMVAIPILCELCPLDALLFGNCENDSGGDEGAEKGGSFGVFAIMRLAFHFASRMRGTSDKSIAVDENGDDGGSHKRNNATLWRNDAVSLRLTAALQVIVGTCAVNSKDDVNNSGSTATSRKMLLSITSVLLSLLIGILELGSGAREAKEEADLQSFLPVLDPLATLVLDNPCDRTDNEESYSDDDNDNSSSVTWAELAEMASHAMALIAARGAEATPTQTSFDKGNKPSQSHEMLSPLGVLRNKISDAECDLTSTQPPVRARGMVALRHVASALQEDQITSPILRQKTDPLLKENKKDEDDNALTILPRILQLSVGALNDKESYVYLASIQTIVAIADVRPNIVFPVVGALVATGHWAWPVAIPVASTVADAVSLGQRNKLAEALIFMVQRTTTISNFVSFLVEIMIFGSHTPAPKTLSQKVSNSSGCLVDETLLQVQQTHSYFLGEGISNCNNDEDSDEKWDAMLRRANAGGPMFVSEENDVVRASRLSVVASVVARAHSSLLANYCCVLVKCSLDALRLETARSVRRAGALLSRDLYRRLALERDPGSLSYVQTSSTNISMAMAMVSAGEEVLCTALERCVRTQDLGDNCHLALSERRCDQRYFDAATVARCREALDYRNEAERDGILATAHLALETKRTHDRHPITRMLRVDDKKGMEDGKSHRSVSPLFHLK